MNFDHPALRILITGKSGSGKSTLVRQIAQRSKARWKFAFDPRREFVRFCNWGFAQDRPSLIKAVGDRRPVSFDSSGLFPGDRAEGFIFFCRWVYTVGQTLPGTKLVIIDELQNVQGVGTHGCPKVFLELLDEGRAHQFDVMTIAQRVNSVNDQVRAQITECVSFLHTSGTQLDWLEKECDFDRAAVKALPKPGGYIWRNLDTDEERTNGRKAPAQQT